MESRAALSRGTWTGEVWSAESGAALEAVVASAAALAALAGAGVDLSDPACTGRPGTEPSGTEPSGTEPSATDSLPNAVSLRDTDPLLAFADACLDGLAELARLESRMAALKVRLSTDYVRVAGALAAPAASPQDRTAQQMAAVAEVACVLTVSERTAGALLADGAALTAALPLTLAALQSGEISWQHARIIVDETSGLDRAGAAALEAHFLDPDAPNPARGCRAGELVASRFRAKARAWRERHHPVSIETRHAKSAADRRVEYVTDRDGMAWISAYLRADTAAGIWDRCTAAARALQGPDEARTLAQLRADTTSAWLLTGGTGGGDAGWAGEVPSPRAQVLVTVPVLSLLGVTDEPAVLDGYGPIPPSMARRLVANGGGSFYRVLTDPCDGAPLEIGRTSYRLTTAQRRWLRLRDAKCTFPTCSNHSLDNEADHLLAWADGGSTGISNLGQPCPKHHRLKHRSAWTPDGASKDHPPGWTSPSGRHYPSEHQDWEPPHWPPQFQPAQDSGGDPRPALTEPFDQEPSWDADLELPPDPFHDWHQFTDWDRLPDPFGTGPAVIAVCL